MTTTLSDLSDAELDANIRNSDRQHCEYLKERRRRQEEKARVIEAHARAVAMKYFESVSVANCVMTNWRYGDLQLGFKNGIPTRVVVADKQVWPVQDTNQVRAEDK